MALKHSLLLALLFLSLHAHQALDDEEEEKVYR
jgi:hypothetical protein